MRVILLIFILTFLSAQKMDDYAKNWRGTLAKPAAFSFHITLQEKTKKTYLLHIVSEKNDLLKTTVESRPNGGFFLKSDTFTIDADRSENQFVLFINSGIMNYSVTLRETAKKIYSGDWLIWLTPEFKPATIYLAIEDVQGENYAAYPFFDESRFSGTFAADFKKEGNQLLFRDFKTGVGFIGTLKKNQIDLQVLWNGNVFNQASLSPFAGNFPIGPQLPPASLELKNPEKLDDGWSIGKVSQLKSEPLKQMISAINSGTLTMTHSVLIARDGKLVFERYFAGFDQSVAHDQRSAQKSISSAIIGIAIDQGIFKNENEKMADYIPADYQHYLDDDPQKRAIRIFDLLTMASGLDANDSDQKSAANENNYQPTSDWLQTVLSAKMINRPGEHALYSSANPFLLGVMLDEKLDEPVSQFMHRNLFQPLGISNYILQNDLNGRTYFAGGLHLRPRDMLKFGQLYLDNGNWNGKQILSKNWIEKSWRKSVNLENRSDKIEYGYYWYRKLYDYKNRQVMSFECRGAGGQYIFVIPELKLCAVVTSGNFRNGRTNQPETIMQNYILKAID